MARTRKTMLIRAAGGLLWRETERGREILIIHRTRYDDWSLPKGKLKDDERWEEAALREVAEETGYRATLKSLAGVTFYYHNEQPKIVLYWNMLTSEVDPIDKEQSDSPDEGDRILWLTVPEALKRMNYESERELVQSEANRGNA